MLLCKKIRVEISEADILALEFMQCPICSLVMDRDENSARNILLRFIARLEPHKLLSVCGVLGSNQVIDTFTHV